MRCIAPRSRALPQEPADEHLPATKPFAQQGLHATADTNPSL